LFVDRHVSTISREIQRNTGGRGYRYKQADEKAVKRRADASRIPQKLTSTLVAIIEEKLPVFTVTYDNGMEFAAHQGIAADLNAHCYFAAPYHSWERGLNEHTNGLIRQYLPKSVDFKDVTNDEIQAIEDRLNNRPRKILG